MCEILVHLYNIIITFLTGTSSQQLPANFGDVLLVHQMVFNSESPLLTLLQHY